MIKFLLNNLPYDIHNAFDVIISSKNFLYVCKNKWGYYIYAPYRQKRPIPAQLYKILSSLYYQLSIQTELIC